MSRTDGFTVMDVSTDIVDDPKFRRIQRSNPDYVAPAFMAYVALLAESWKAGRRLGMSSAWPTLLGYDERIFDAMLDAELLDSRGMVPLKAWNDWFKAASERREKARERWRRANAKRDQPNGDHNAGTALAQRGNNAATATTVPYRTAPSVPSVPTESPPPPINGTKTPLPPALAQIERQRLRVEDEPIRSLAERGIKRP